MKKRLFSFLVVFALALALTTPALATSELQDNIEERLTPFGSVYGQEGEDVDPQQLAIAIAKIIEIILGFLGIVFLILIIYAGLVWMTSGGNEEKVTSAKKTMVAAIIGAAIVLAAYAITAFVIGELLDATGVSS